VNKGRVGQEAALALGKIGDAATAPALTAALEQASDETSPESEQLRIRWCRPSARLRRPTPTGG